jgi:hypothetical protein
MLMLKLFFAKEVRPCTLGGRRVVFKTKISESASVINWKKTFSNQKRFIVPHFSAVAVSFFLDPPKNQTPF